MDIRPPPIAPPPYVQAVRRVYPKPLRPVVLLFSSVAFIWALVLGVKFMQDRDSSSETTRMKIFDLVLAILFFLVAGIEIFGIAAVGTQKIVWTRIYFVLAGLAGLFTASAELIRVIAHFVVKKDLIDDCRNELTGAKAETLTGAIASIDATEARRLCEDDWQRGVWWDLGWLVLTSSLALLFTGLVGAYYHQLLNPSLSRTRDLDATHQIPPAQFDRSNSNNSFQLESYNHAPMTSYHLSQDAPFVPPQYLHPPEYRPRLETDANHNNNQIDDKKDGMDNVNLSHGGAS